MAVYTCEACGMGVTGMQCAECGHALIHDQITTGDGSTVGVAKCPNDCGMIKSPTCCGQDMIFSPHLDDG